MDECEYCSKPATWILNVQWSVVDLLDVLTCNQHLTPATIYWQRRTVEGLDPIITRQPILDANSLRADGPRPRGDRGGLTHGHQPLSRRPRCPDWPWPGAQH